MYNVAIDGPAGAGKSTIAKKIAKQLGFIYVDTGAMYRAMALACIRNNVDKDDEEAVVAVCSQINVTIAYESDMQIVMLNGENVNGYIRTEEVGNTASAISVYKDVRLKLLELQRNLAKENNVIMDGRDIGTYVLPDAFVKIYLTASSRTRAERRSLELKEKGIEVNIEEVEKDIIDRDYRDMHREIAPLSQAEDAVLVDSSNMGIDEVVEHIIKIIEDRK
ncbi:MAG: (d)CMP kinase [Lachnospiraceae bacterium]|nr:(d)CMP kinase [Lachnospiraceae bacterium]